MKFRQSVEWPFENLIDHQAHRTCFIVFSNKNNGIPKVGIIHLVGSNQYFSGAQLHSNKIKQNKGGVDECILTSRLLHYFQKPICVLSALYVGDKKRPAIRIKLVQA